MLHGVVENAGAKAADAESRQVSRLLSFWRIFRTDFSGMLGLAAVGILIVLALLAPVIAPYDPYLQSLQSTLLPPSARHLAGTDELGRDVLSRMLYGARTTLLVVVSVSVLVAPIGLLIGICAGYFGGWIDRTLMRVVDIFLALPSLVLALGFVAALGAGTENAVLAIALTAWPPIARLARAETLTIRSSDYIAAARMYGASSFRIITAHVVPLCMPSIIVRVTLSMASVILTAAGLGFLGLGAQPPSAEWGTMISTGRKVMIDHWWVAAFPGIAILVTSLSFNLIGDALRDALDPRKA
ncbi:ABC transporter permease [Rhizobium sp. XQZ8]|uniref:ABC transporter permease n=1 Tax=Rhizobium populisoli TaxID=2859785 RepID=UPI001C66E29F|nr:ABC transporter permease [Rhizobium populisoli]MBW6425869.1 ABC transporter permease [Rhizobium populisoli]